MSENPYAPPKAELTDQRKPAMSPWKAVLLGLTIDIGGSLLIGVLVGAAYGVYLVRSGMNPAQIGAEMSNMSPTSWFAIFGMLAGAVLSFLGGVVCTRVARRDNYSLGLVLASISASIGLLSSFSQYSTTMNLLLTSLTFSTVMLGTKFGQVKNEVQPQRGSHQAP